MISWVTSPGWVIRERWPASISAVVACMRPAMNRCSPGEMVRSCRETAYQAGRDRQAATVVRSPKRVCDTRPCTA